MRRTPCLLLVAMAIGCGSDRDGAHVDAPPSPDAAPPDASPPDAAPTPDAPVAACGPNVATDVPCTTQGELCVTDTGCCVCGGLAGVCAGVWVCAQPADNDPTCPPALPEDVAACTVPAGIRCAYCRGAVPYHADCADAAGWRQCELAGRDHCWWTAPAGAHCDWTGRQGP